MAKKTHDLAIKVGEYTDPATGQPKNKYLNVGALFARDDGSLAIKLEALPIGVPQWTGWISAFPARPKEAHAAAPPAPQAVSPRQAPAAPQYRQSSPLDDDIPF